MTNFRLHAATFACCALASTLVAPAVMAKDQFHFRFAAAEGQSLTWNRGVQAIEAAGSQAVIRLIDSRDQLPDNQTAFRVTVLNNGENAIEIAPQNVWLEDSSGKRIVMLSHDELEGRHRRDIKRRQALAVLSGALSAGSANGYTSGSFDYSGMTSNGTMFSGFGTYSAFDPALAQQQSAAVAAQNQATMNAIQIRQLAGADALNGMLRETTLQPGQITSGIVAFDPPRNAKKTAGSEVWTIVVRLGSEDHRFQTKLVKLP